MLLYKTD